jgi:radical SAM superfamily enzyme YgiQ (UPF0313 family)
MKTLLVALNSKFVHINLAVRNIVVCCKDKDINYIEVTINDLMEDVLEEIFSRNPDIVGLSCYIWNIEHILYLAENIKKINPKIFIVLGGPEASYEAREIMAENKSVDFIIMGEGEERFKKLLDVLENGGIPAEIDGIAYRKRDTVEINQLQGYVNLTNIPLAYNEREDLADKIVYYETSRGCPFKCAFCLSSLDTHIREADIDKVSKDLRFFAAKEVKVVKLVDRSFNCNIKRAGEILDIIRESPGKTVFHCEVNPELVNDDFVGKLKGLEKRLQFEVGVQTTNPESLKAVSRPSDSRKALKGIKKLKKAGIKLHADLIAGLPYDDINSFAKSFDDLYKLGPGEIQLGFLKLLKGTRLRREADKYGICFESKPPYEILYNNYISYSELRLLKGISKLLNWYYNGGRFKHSLAYLIKKYSKPFELYESFYNFWKKNGLFRKRHSLRALYDILFSFASILEIDVQLFQDIIKFDFMYSNFKGNYPDCIKHVEDKIFYGKAGQICNKQWLDRNIPEAFGLSESEFLKDSAFGLFKYDVPESCDKKYIGILFFQRDKQTHYAKFDYR